MKLHWLASGVSAAALLVFCAPIASAADLPSRKAEPVFVAPPVFSWNGVYLGGFVGGGSGETRVSNPFGGSIYGDKIRTSFIEGGGQLGYNFQSIGSRFVFGLEADGGAVGLSATNTCLAVSGFQVPGNCHVSATEMATGTGRIGYAFGPEGRTLAYAKGGVAALFGERDITTENSVGVPGTYSQRDSARVGYTVGGGIEQALSSAWSVKVEYDYADFGSSGIATPRTTRFNGAALVAVPASNTSFRQELHELKVGLNYHFGADPKGSFFGAPGAIGSVATLPGFAFNQGYAIEVGGRYWYSFGRFQKDLAAGPTAPRNALISRLTYNDTANTGEFYGRIDTPVNVFVKGFIGAGKESSGHQNDEDFLIAQNIPYSNTLSGQKGTIDYATIDLGYAFLKSQTTSIGVFAGYNYYKDNKASLGCQQIANQNSDCAGNQAQPRSVVGITENDRYDSLRVGANADMWIQRFRVQADAAYLPLVDYKGTDTHLQRFDVANQASPQFGHGQGVQLELITSYYFTPNFSVGVGGRYWGMMIPGAKTDIFTTGNITPLPIHSERYGLLAQASYRFATAPAAVVAKY